MQHLVETSLEMLRMYFNNFDVVETSVPLQHASLLGNCLLSSIMNKLMVLLLGN